MQVANTAGSACDAGVVHHHINRLKHFHCLFEPALDGDLVCESTSRMMVFRPTDLTSATGCGGGVTLSDIYQSTGKGVAKFHLP
jgi:hypothetical protein